MMKRFLIGLMMLNFMWLAMPQPAGAFDPFDGVDCGLTEEQKSAVCSRTRTDEDPIGGTNGALAKASRIIAIIAGAAAVIVIIVGAIRYMTANGDASKISNAKSTVINTLIGLAIIVLAQAIIVFVIRRL